MTSTTDKIAVMQHYADGGKIEIKSHSSEKFELWIAGEPTWTWNNTFYRIAVTKPSINWDHVAPEYRWLAMHNCGGHYLFETKPILDSCSEWAVTGKELNPEGFASFTPGTCSWKDSLVQRPEGKDDD